jgi:hypothetical protein
MEAIFFQLGLIDSANLVKVHVTPPAYPGSGELTRHSFGWLLLAK